MNINKYPLEIDGLQFLHLRLRKILDIQIQDGVPQLWCIEDAREGRREIRIVCQQTGSELLPYVVDLTYISTTQHDGLDLHWFTDVLNRRGKMKEIIEQEQITREKTVFIYDEADIDHLIRRDLSKRGYPLQAELGTVNIVSDFKHVADKWGTNARIKPYFKEVRVEMKGKAGG